MKRYTIEDLKGKRIAVHVPQREQYNKVSAHFGLGTEYGYWDIYRINACLDLLGVTLGYASRGYYESEGYTIIEFDQLTLPGDNPFSPGDVLTLIDDDRQLLRYTKEGSEFVKDGESVCPEAYKAFRVKKVEGEYIQEQTQTIIWFKASDFKPLKERKEEIMKQLFTVEGSMPLKRALLEELKEDGITLLNETTLITYHLGPCQHPENNKRVQVFSVPQDVHYTLPQDYNKALQAFRDFFKPEYRVGDIVKVTDVIVDYKGTVGKVGKIVEILNPSTHTYPYKVDTGDGYRLHSFVVPATEKEMEEWKNSTEKIVVDGHEMRVVEVKDEKVARFGACTQVSVAELRFVISLLERNATITVGNTPITKELVNQIINKLK